ncbi:MAG: hypothetical protein ACRERU_19845 [Methylococcales bacterium]
MSHELAEKLGGLASRVNNLAVHQTGSESRTLLESQDRLTKLELVAIVKELSSDDDDYKTAIQGLNEAIAFIGEATKKIENIALAIQLIAKAADLAEKAIKTAAA